MQNKSLKKTASQIKEIFNAWLSSQVSTYGASVAYYTIFSIAPLLVIALSITGIFLNYDAAQASILAQFRDTFGQNGANLIQTLIQTRASTQTNIVLSVVGFIILFIGATGVFSQLQKALDKIFDFLPVKIDGGFWQTIIKKLLSFGMVLSVGFLLFLSLMLSALITFFSSYISNHIPGAIILTQIVELIISFALISFFLSLIYKVLPSRKISWTASLIGGCIAGSLFTISKYLLGFYFASSSAFNGYGIASSLVLLIVWAFYMSQVFLLSAILVRLYVIPKEKMVL